MVVEHRVEYLRKMVRIGARVVVTISSNPTTGVEKIKVVVDPTTYVPCVQQSFVSMALGMLEKACVSHMVADKGHRHSVASGGKSEVHFYVTPRPAVAAVVSSPQAAVARPFSAGEGALEDVRRGAPGPRVEVLLPGPSAAGPMEVDEPFVDGHVLVDALSSSRDKKDVRVVVNDPTGALVVTAAVEASGPDAAARQHSVPAQHVGDSNAPVFITLMVQGPRGSVPFRIKKSTVLRKLMAAYCSRLGLQASHVRFLGDGGRIAPEDTAESLGLEDFCIIVIATKATAYHILVVVKDPLSSNYYSLLRSTPLRRLMEMYRSSQGLPLQASRVRVIVGNRCVAPDDTAESLGLDDDGIIVVVLESGTFIQQ